MKSVGFGKKINNKIKDFQIRERCENHNYINAAYKAREWIYRNTIHHKGIVITNKQRQIYQEVTGYYIPTLLQWGMRDLAIEYASYLCEIQQPNGAWLNFNETLESVFNTGQVLRGLLAISDIYPCAKEHLIKGCEWLVSNMNDEGRLVAIEGTIWSDNGFNTELIHLYCLPPLRDTGLKYGIIKYIDATDRILNYYKKEYIDDILNFNYLSHFYAYVLEALYDLGETRIVKMAMKKIERMQRPDGAVPALKNCKWVCSTGLFQLAIVWFKMGDFKHGDKAFDYAVKLQNKSGGWYGGYSAKFNLPLGKSIEYATNEKITYFDNEEISWAVKYFFDAMYYRSKCEFEYKAHTFMNCIDSQDEKYLAVVNEISKINKAFEAIKIVDIGCGKGRYLKKLYINNPKNEYWGIDISQEVLKYIRSPKINTKTGSILYTGFDSDTFDFVYATESLEHAVFIDLAIKEMVRITKPGGVIVIIDKEAESFELVKYCDWIDPAELSTKQWLNTSDVEKIFNNSDISNFRAYYLPTNEVKMYKAYIGRKNYE